MQVDARNSGDWSNCVDIPNLELLQKGWVKKAYIGITATTGQLADNHDVLSLKTYSDAKVMEAEESQLVASGDVRFKFEDNNLKSNFVA